MPRVLFDEEGNEIEVPSEEELTNLSTSAKAYEDNKDKIAEYEEMSKDPNNKNWKEVRDKIKSLEKTNEALRARGLEVNEEGNVVDYKPEIKIDDVTNAAKKAARETIIEERIASNLRKYGNDDERNTVKHYFDKLSSGEELTIEKVDKFMQESESIVKPVNVVKDSYSMFNSRGGVPRYEDKKEVSDEAKSLGKSAFGLKEEDFDKEGDLTQI